MACEVPTAAWPRTAVAAAIKHRADRDILIIIFHVLSATRAVRYVIHSLIFPLIQTGSSLSSLALLPSYPLTRPLTRVLFESVPGHRHIRALTRGSPHRGTRPSPHPPRPPDSGLTTRDERVATSGRRPAGCRERGLGEVLWRPWRRAKPQVLRRTHRLREEDRGRRPGQALATLGQGRGH